MGRRNARAQSKLRRLQELPSSGCHRSSGTESITTSSLTTSSTSQLGHVSHTIKAPFAQMPGSLHGDRSHVPGRNGHTLSVKFPEIGSKVINQAKAPMAVSLGTTSRDTTLAHGFRMIFKIARTTFRVSTASRWDIDITAVSNN